MFWTELLVSFSCLLIWTPLYVAEADVLFIGHGAEHHQTPNHVVDINQPSVKLTPQAATSQNHFWPRHHCPAADFWGETNQPSPKWKRRPPCLNCFLLFPPFLELPFGCTLLVGAPSGAFLIGECCAGVHMYIAVMWTCQAFYLS